MKKVIQYHMYLSILKLLIEKVFRQDTEGCLSVPGKSGMVPRAQKVKVKAFNENMEEFEMEAEGLLARCILHENDHLDGIVYVDKVEGKLYDNSELYPEEEQ